MKFHQRRFFNQTSFDFGEDKLKYMVKRNSAKKVTSFRYADINMKDLFELEERNDWYRNAGVFWIILGSLQMFYRFQSEQTFKLSFWVLVGFIFVGIYSVIKTSYTIFEASNDSNILVIQNKAHDTIIKELRERRKKQLLAMYGEINFYNNEEDEIRKFEWLLEHEAISEKEFADIKNKIIITYQTGNRDNNRIDFNQNNRNN